MGYCSIMTDKEKLPADLESLATKIRVQAALTPEDISAAQRLIRVILYEPNEFQFSTASDDEEQTIYVVAKDGNEVVGAGRLRLNPHWKEVVESGVLDVLQNLGIMPEDAR